MERRRDVGTQTSVVSETGMEQRNANQAKDGQKPAARVESQAAIEKQALVQHALKAVYRSPEVRTEKIKALRARIETGTYQVNRTSLAMKLLGVIEQDAG